MKVHYKGHLSRWKTDNAKDMYQNISYILLHNGNQVDKIYYGGTQASPVHDDRHKILYLHGRTE